MARRVSAYGRAKSRESLLSNLLVSQAKQKKSKVAIGKQKKKMQREFQRETQQLYDKALAEGKSPLGNVFKLANLVSTLSGNPLAAFLVNTATNMYMKDRERKASKGLLNLNMSRWGDTFLSEAGDSYLSKAEEQQISQSKVLLDSLIAGGTAAMSAGGLKKGYGDQTFLQAAKSEAGLPKFDEFIKQIGTGQGDKFNARDMAVISSTLPQLLKPLAEDWQGKGTYNTSQSNVLKPEYGAETNVFKPQYKAGRSQFPVFQGYRKYV
tara:strand:- start:4561 stop:5358 length:798 start_codon:yes stop_codon:yes gene_type:complete